MIKNIKLLKEAGAYHMETVRNSFIDSLNSIALSTKAASANKPIYSHGNLGMTRKTKNYEYHYFITRLGIYTEELFKTPLYKVIAITTNVLFDKDSLFTEDNVKKKLFDFKNGIRFQSNDSGVFYPES